MDSWEKVKISSFAEVVGGGTPSRKKEDIYFGGNIPWLSPRDLSDHNSRFVKRGAENITEEGLNNSSAKLLPKNAILFSSRATIGNVAIAKNPITTSQGFRSLVCKNGKANPDFIYYALQYYTPEIEQIASGATYKEISGSALADFEINLPPLETQQKVASILSAFDDLIENNNHRIEILEEMARRIYREWFVHFRYPGHQEDELVDSGTELGEIPEGWVVKEFGDLVNYERDRVKDDEVEEKVPVLGLGDMPKKSITLSEWENTDDIGSTKLRFKKDDILFGKIRPYFHKAGFAQTIGVCSSDIFVWRPKERKDFVLSLLVASSDKFVETATNSSSGTKMPRAKWDVPEKYLVTYPPDNLLEKLNSSVGSSLKQIRTLSFQNKRLKETRDLLLPKLITGNIDVEKV